jgi:hypothetical protein
VAYRFQVLGVIGLVGCSAGVDGGAGDVDVRVACGGAVVRTFCGPGGGPRVQPCRPGFATFRVGGGDEMSGRSTIYALAG